MKNNNYPAKQNKNVSRNQNNSRPITVTFNKTVNFDHCPIKIEIHLHFPGSK